MQSSETRLVNAANSETIAKFISDGAVELYYDNSKIFETGSDQATITGKLTINRSSNDEKLILSGSASPYIRFQESTTNKAYMQWSSNGYIEIYNSETSKGMRIGGQGVEVLDDIKIAAGNSSDLQLYHDGTSSLIKNTTGDLYVQSIADVKIRTLDTELAINCEVNGAVELYHDASQKFKTTGVGVSVTGLAHVQAPVVGGDLSDALVLTTTSYSTGGGQRIVFKTDHPTYNTWRYAEIGATYSGGAYGGDLIFKTNNGSSPTNLSEEVRILRSGGITFNGDTATANALDDYEEGTFTTSIVQGLGTLSATYDSTGRYTKIGRFVHVQAIIQFGGVGNGTQVRLKLPFTHVTSTALGGGVISFTNVGGLDGQSTLTLIGASGQSYCAVQNKNSNPTISGTQNNQAIYYHFSYEAA